MTFEALQQNTDMNEPLSIHLFCAVLHETDPVFLLVSHLELTVGV